MHNRAWIGTNIFNFFLIGLFTLCVFGCSTVIDTEHSTEKITYKSGKFDLAGELRTPGNPGKYPVVVLVHGDGRGTITMGGMYNPLMDRFLKAGYACFSYDKPGFGNSTGEFDGKRLRRERAEILVDAIRTLKKHASIDPDRIGLWGISQAGWVMPLAMELTDDIAFMIVVSGGGENGIEQMGFLIRKQAECIGFSEEDAGKLDSLWVKCFKAQTYEEYAEAGEILVKVPLINDLNCFASVRPRDVWSPPDSSGEALFDPMGIIERTDFPILAFFAEKDTQVDPEQGHAAYTAALQKSGNPHSRAELLAGVDHNMLPAETGCLSEQRNRSRRDWQNYAPEYLDLMENWLRDLP